MTSQNTSSGKLAQAMPGGHWLGLPPDLPHMIVRQLQEPFLPWHERQAGLRPVKKSRNGAMLDESPASGRPAQYGEVLSW